MDEKFVRMLYQKLISYQNKLDQLERINDFPNDGLSSEVHKNAISHMKNSIEDIDGIITEYFKLHGHKND